MCVSCSMKMLISVYNNSVRHDSLLHLSVVCSVEAMRSEYLSIIQVTGDYVLSTDDPDGLFFDPGKFRANKEVVILKYGMGLETCFILRMKYT